MTKTDIAILHLISLGFTVKGPEGVAAPVQAAPAKVARPSLAERVDAQTSDDSDAPYGRKKDGTPKKAPGRPRGAKNKATPAAPVKAATPAPVKAAVKAPAPAKVAPSLDLSAVFGNSAPAPAEPSDDIDDMLADLIL